MLAFATSTTAHRLRSYRCGMGWFRRSRSVDTATTTADEDAPGERHLPVPVAPAAQLARTERALQMLAAQSAQLHTSVVHLEHRVDALSAAVADQLDRPSYDDLLATRVHSARTAAELARLEVNIAARLEQVRDEMAELRRHGSEVDVDLREPHLRLTPADTGWPLAAS